MNFDAYLLAASPPANFGMNYLSSGLTFQKLGTSLAPYGCKVEAYEVLPDEGRNGNRNILNLKEDCYHRNRWSADMSDMRRVNEVLPHGFRDSSPSLRTRKSGCMYRPSADLENNNKSFHALRSCLRSSSPNPLCTETLHETDDEQLVNGFSGGNGRGRRKKVSFADDIGRRLFIVKIFEEQPDMPSYIHPTRALSGHTQSSGATSHRKCKSSPLICAGYEASDRLNTSLSSSSLSSSPSSSEDEADEEKREGDCSEQGESGRCLLVPNFSMPAANYSTFRKKVEDNCVSLETACQRESSGDLWGTVKVKDLTYEKRVFLRVTFDSWRSHTDVEAEYLPPSDPSIAQGRPLPFATFSFRIAQPPDSLALSREGVKFAVCFVASGVEHWDNNLGSNYEFLAPDWAAPGFNSSSSRRGAGEQLDRRNTTQDTVYSACSAGNWGSYASWSELDSAVPYW